ncbi:ParA family protein [Janthinobacterium sp. FW305-128]|uniref:ParA family protein n=1 Tax=Janthinobacterium sp. FW305-128 TaxID=2775055 RepID=UPI001E5F99D0|nr:ParA family protein [Janthinobacterium sp. FW305-128]MCC7684732.1 ParA family protein [Janthinobacterium sp. FW305-128]
MKTLVVANQKGGQSKTTEVFHIGTLASVKQKKRVLYVDNDPQGSLSILIPSSPGAEGSGMLSSALYEKRKDLVVPEVVNEFVSILRRDKSMLNVRESDIGNPAENLARIAGDYELCIIDNAGSLGHHVNASLIAADWLISPVAVGLLEMAGLSDLFDYVREIQNSYNPNLKFMGLLPSKVNPSSPEELAALEELQEQLGELIIPHTLFERASVKQAIAGRRPVWHSTKGAGHLKAGKEWKAACEFILNKMGV